MSNRETMSDKLKLLDVVALTEELPEEGLRRGQVGTIVEELAPDVYEVEFSEKHGSNLRHAGTTCRTVTLTTL